MRHLLIGILLVLSPIAAVAKTGPACTASLYGLKIQNVYITGHDYNGVIWAYKHLADATCMTPVTNINKADVILDLEPPPDGSRAATPEDPSVLCSSSGGSTVCTDSEGNELDVTCNGAGSCYSSYGPSLAASTSSLFMLWLDDSNANANAYLYSLNHKLIWSSEASKHHFPAILWYEKLLLDTNEPSCKRRVFSNYRKFAAKHCGVQFPARVSIDLVKRTKTLQASKASQQRQQMEENAKAAAASQASRN